MSTTTSPTSAARSSTASSTPGRASTQRSGRGRPVSTSKPIGHAPGGTARTTSASRLPALTSRAAASRPETSSSTPRCCATAPPCGSASTSTLGWPRWACSAASPIASVVRPGRRRGRAPRSTRPAGRVRAVRTRLGQRVGVDDELPGARRRDGLGQRVEVSGRPRRRRRRSGSSGPPDATDRDAAHVVAQQLHHRVGVETGELPGDHGDVGLAGGRAGQQVGQVDAPLEHD